MSKQILQCPISWLNWQPMRGLSPGQSEAEASLFLTAPSSSDVKIIVKWRVKCWEYFSTFNQSEAIWMDQWEDFQGLLVSVKMRLPPCILSLCTCHLSLHLSHNQNLKLATKHHPFEFTFNFCLWILRATLWLVVVMSRKSLPSKKLMRQHPIIQPIKENSELGVMSVEFSKWIFNPWPLPQYPITWSLQIKWNKA